MSSGEAHEPTSDMTGASVYNPLTLALYDAWVLGCSCRFVWGCPKQEILEAYERNVGPNHLDIGVGTGFFLDRAASVTPETRLELLDLNPTPLRTAANRLSGYQVHTHTGDATEEIPLDTDSLDSVGTVNLLHCVPGGFERKATIFDHVRRVLRPGGRIFGSTVLGGGSEVRIGRAARRVMGAYQARGFFDNANDTQEALRRELQSRFTDVRVTVRGCMGVFEGTAFSSPASPG